MFPLLSLSVISIVHWIKEIQCVGSQYNPYLIYEYSNFFFNCKLYYHSVEFENHFSNCDLISELALSKDIVNTRI